MKIITQSILQVLLLCFGLFAFGQNNKLLFHSNIIGKIRVENDSIFVNNKSLYHFEKPSIDYSSKLNRLIEDNQTVFLFLVIYGNPNRDRMHGFKITKTKIDSVVDAIASEIKDFDNDGFLEFGGSDLTEMHPSKDSMYYIPSAYYEIKTGKILFDSVLTKKKDIEVNGIYLKDQLDENGNCCKVIPRPKRKIKK